MTFMTTKSEEERSLMQAIARAASETRQRESDYLAVQIAKRLSGAN